jgi:selenocysteine-specific elongation factor
VSRVRSLQTAQREVAEAQPGSRLAINLPDVICGKRGSGGVARGDVITGRGVGTVTRVIDVVLKRTERTQGPDGTAEVGTRLRDNVEVKLHHGAQSAQARVRLLDAQELLPGQRCLARLRLQTPLLLLIGDRAVLRSASELHTLCGATVLDVSPPRGRAFRLRQGSSQARAMAKRAADVGNIGLIILSLIERDGVTHQEELLPALPCSAEAMKSILVSLAARGELVVRGSHLISAAGWIRLQQQGRDAIDRHHRDHPEQQGLPLARLRAELLHGLRACGFRAPELSLCDAAIDALCEEGFIRAATVVARASHRIALPSRLRAAGESCRRQLMQHPLDPPSKKDLCKSDLAVQAMRFLMASGEVVEVGPDVVLSAEAFAFATRAVRSHLQTRGTSTVSELKAVLGSSRRVVVPLLERLDRDGVTRRQGDVRTLKT